jgi:succinate dehydrogenase/fumarate reductase flavoprotein subunit
MPTPSEPFSESWDVVVIGFGYAGGVAAVEAHDAGARVLLLEKMSAPGGISVCSAGGVRVAFDEEAAFGYLHATNAGSSPESVLRQLARGMVSLPEQLRGLAETCGAAVEVRRAPGNYPFPGAEALGFASIAEGLAAEYPHVQGSPAGARLFKVVEENVARRGIAVRMGTPAHRLVRAPERAVLGVVLETGERIRAERGVVLACGGFEANPEMHLQHWQATPVLSAAFRGNVGDGVRMAQDLGASLWHMWHYHGSYGFRHPDPAYPFGIRTKRLPDWTPGGAVPKEVEMPWILLDRDGHRFMNEYEPYVQDTGHRPLQRFRPETQDYPRLPAWLVADDEGRRLCPFGRPTYNDPELAASFSWSRDNLREVELGILERADDLAALAEGLGVGRRRLEESLTRWNLGCERGEDVDFGRPPSSMVPIAVPPFYYARVWPIVSNTQGGPVHDAEQRIVDVYGDPIAGLFAAGELGSAFGHLYLSGGNLAECFVGGRIAGRGAAAGGVGRRQV